MNYQSLMQRAISLAYEVKSTGDVPVGALIVNEVGEIISFGKMSEKKIMIQLLMLKLSQ